MQITDKTDGDRLNDYDVFCHEDTVVERNSQLYTCIKVDVKTGEELYFEPNKEFQIKYNLLMPHELVKVSDNELIPIRIVNLVDRDIILRPGTRIGRLKPLAQVNLMEINEPTENMIWIKDAIKHLTEKQQKELGTLMKKYQDVFAKSDTDLGECTVAMHPILKSQ